MKTDHILARAKYFDRREMSLRANIRSAQPGNNRAAVIETVRLLEAGILKLDNDLVV